MKRRFRLWWGTMRVRWEKYWTDLTEFYIRKTCPHYWRGVRIEDIDGMSPGKVCRMCDTYRKMTIEEFYAEFGEIGMGTLHQ